MSYLEGLIVLSDQPAACNPKLFYIIFNCLCKYTAAILLAEIAVENPHTEIIVRSIFEISHPVIRSAFSESDQSLISSPTTGYDDWVVGL